MQRVLIGESYVGDGAEAAHVNTVLGDRDGPAGNRAPIAGDEHGSLTDVLAARHEPSNPFFTLAPAT